MKKLAIMILVILTMCTATLFGCSKESQYKSRSFEITEPEKLPEPKTPRKHHGKNLPRPKPAYIKNCPK